MNERIREIAGEADKWAAEEFHRLFLNNVNPNRQELFNKKFAELILKECLKYIDDSFGDIDYVKFMIKRNFGVEE